MPYYIRAALLIAVALLIVLLAAPLVAWLFGNGVFAASVYLGFVMIIMGMLCVAGNRLTQQHQATRKVGQQTPRAPQTAGRTPHRV